MAFNIDKTTDSLSRDEFERLYAEAFDYISMERQRLGEDAKELVWNTFEQPSSFIHRYEVDGYLVGAAALDELSVTWEGNDERWAWYLTPLYGETQSGSRSWWYDEEFTKQARAFVDDDGFDKLVVIFNEGTPAAIATQASWGRQFEGRQYFETVLIKTLDEVFGERKAALNSPDTARCFVMPKYTG